MKNKRAFIIGYGSAGKRHAATLKELGYLVRSFDLFPGTGATTSDTDRLFDTLEKEHDFVVIATPPDTHLEYIRLCSEFGHNIVCEKPLFGFENRADIDELGINLNKIAVTYNYRFHPTLLDAVERYAKTTKVRNWWYMYCGQFRIHTPSWGYVLDHISHDIDIILWMCGAKSSDIIVENAVNKNNFYLEQTSISGHIMGDRLEILDIVYKSPYSRFANINTPWDWHSIDANPLMFLNMWKSIEASFQSGNVPYPSIFDAYETQLVLEKINREMVYVSNN